MNIVVDTNIFIAALIMDSFIRKLLMDFRMNYLFPDFELDEIYNHKKEIMKKGLYGEFEFNKILLRLLKYVKVISVEVVVDKREEAEEIMRGIDLDDSVFIVTALKFGCPIWSDDKHFKKQDRVKVYNTEEFVRLL
ncbi:MAG: PIN domain-containing protein [Nanoarchaeota archaeon]|nr:PIN domain-containing protein [Nanoarchaeota archaeon]